METTFEKKAMCLAVLGVGVKFIASFASPMHPGLANAQQNKTLMQPQGIQSTTTTNASKMNIILVHGAWADDYVQDKQLANDYFLFTKALHSRLDSCSTSTLLGGGHYD